MKKFKLILVMFFTISFLTGCNNNYNNINTKQEQNAYSTSTSNTALPQATKISTQNIISSLPTATPTPAPEIISEFSTKIYDKTPERQNNIELTCSKINGYTVKSGETFSFCDTVGKATKDAGYQKAKIFDKDGNVQEGYGGR